MGQAHPTYERSLCEALHPPSTADSSSGATAGCTQTVHQSMGILLLLLLLPLALPCTRPTNSPAVWWCATGCYYHEGVLGCVGGPVLGVLLLPP